MANKTLGDLVTEVETILGDSTNTVWSEAEIQSYVKEGYDDLCITTEPLWKRDTPAGLDDVASQATYTLPTDLLKIERVTWHNLRLVPLMTDKLLRTDPAFRTLTGTVYGYCVDGDGLGVLRKVRVPANTEADTTSIEYVRRGATLSSTSVELELPDRYAAYVRFFALARCLERDGPGQKPQAADHYMARYRAGQARLRKRKAAAHKARIGRLGQGSERESPIMDVRYPWQYPRQES